VHGPLPRWLTVDSLLLRYYEHGNWSLYCCHPRFKQMGTTPGLAMTFPVAPFIKVPRHTFICIYAILRSYM
jgi:hypothetical protein